MYAYMLYVYVCMGDTAAHAAEEAPPDLEPHYIYNRIV